MKRLKLTVAYDGTNYCGWQVQPGVPTIEGELNKALSRLTGEDIQVIGASRTDAGVHACGNVAVFDSGTPIPGEKMMFALNPHLPEDIRVVDSCEVAADFHRILRYEENIRISYPDRADSSADPETVQSLVASPAGCRCHERSGAVSGGNSRFQKLLRRPDPGKDNGADGDRDYR